MCFSPRLKLVFILIAVLLFVPSSIQAQDESQIVVVGSGIAQPVFQGLVDASGSDATFSIDVTGTTTGFADFCSGEADITTATRRIATDEKTSCAENQVVALELMVGHNILAFIGNPADDPAMVCLTGAELNTLYAPSAEGEITNWNQVLTEGPDLVLTVLAPGDITPEYTILDALIEGDGIRGDATVADSPEAVITVVGETPGAIGVVTLPQAEAAGSSVRILELDAASTQGCQTASAASVEDSLYPAAESLYFYVNTANLEKAGLGDFLNYVVSAEAQAAVESLGFTALTDGAVQTNQDNIQAAESGELLAQTDTGFVIPAGVAGQADIGGAGDGYRFLKSSTDDFTAVAPGVTVNLKLEGLPAGLRRLCNGEVDLVYSYRDVTTEEADNCAANNITLQTIGVGIGAPVVVGNANSPYLSCLTTEELVKIWDAASSESITNWNQVNSDFPDAPMTLFSPTEGNSTTDLLLLAASGQSLAGRVDVNLSADPLYRAAATANVDGALTFMTWSEYQRVLANNQANIQLTAIDAGQGCITPAVSSVRSGNYPLIRSGALIVNQSGLTRPEIQSLLWYIFSEENFSSFDSSGYVGVRLTDLSDVRSSLLAAFDAARAAAAEATPEAESAGEATAEATEETQ